MPKILFICTANQCRSPIAALLFAKAIKTFEPAQHWQVESAGIWAFHNTPSPSRLVRVAAEYALDLRQHRSRGIEQIMHLSQFDLILTMERGQCEALQTEIPALASRIHQLSSLVGLRYDISDPVGGSSEEFRIMVVELQRLINKALPRIVQMATTSVQPMQPILFAHKPVYP